MSTKTVVVLSLLSCTLSPMLLGCARSSEGRPVRTDEPSAPIQRKVAILPFKNLTPSEETDWMGPAMAHCVGVRIGLVNALRRTRARELGEVLSREENKGLDLADPLSAVQVASALGAERIVIGTYAWEAERISFDLRVVDSRSAVIVKEIAASGRSTEAFSLMGDLVEAIVRSYDRRAHEGGSGTTVVDVPRAERICLSEQDRVQIRAGGTCNLAALRALASGVAATETDEKIRWYTEATRLAPEFAWAHNNRGLYLAKQSKYDEAIAAYDVTVQLDPQFAWPRRNRGLAYREKGQFDRAIKDHSKAIELKPDYAAAFNGRGLTHYDMGQYDRAIEDYNRAIELRPDYARAYTNRGLVHYFKGQHDRAIEDHSKAIGLKPDFAAALNNRGLAYAGKGQFDLAIADYHKAIESKPDYAKAHNNLGWTRLKMGELARAIPHCSRAIELDCDYAKAYANRGRAYTEMRRFDLAIADCRKAVESKPEYGWSYYVLGAAYEGADRPQEALNAYREYARLTSTKDSPQYRHAQDRIRLLHAGR